jgi:hypothetical protein
MVMEIYIEYINSVSKISICISFYCVVIAISSVNRINSRIRSCRVLLFKNSITGSIIIGARGPKNLNLIAPRIHADGVDFNRCDSRFYTQIHIIGKEYGEIQSQQTTYKN